MTFPIRPRHIPGEPASGYARRLAEANGYDWRSNPFAGRGVSTALLARGNTRALVPFLGRGMVDGIDRYSPRRMRDGHISLNGEKLEPAQVFYERQRYCVACWADDAAGETGGQFPMRHLRCWWSVAAVTVCPIHNVRLNDRCLQCDRTIRLAGGARDDLSLRRQSCPKYPDRRRRACHRRRRLRGRPTWRMLEGAERHPGHPAAL